MEPSLELPPGHRKWFRFCVLAIVVAVGARLLHYVPFRLPGPVEWLLGTALLLEIYALIGAFLLLVPNMLAGAAVALLLLLRRRWCLVRAGGRWATRPWLHSLIWAELLVNNYALDIDVRLSLLCWVSLPALWAPFWGRIDRLTRWRKLARTAIGAVFVAVAILGAPGPLDGRAALFYCAGFVPLAVFGSRRLAQRDRFWMALFLSACVQYLLSEMPRDMGGHGGVQIGFQDYAYTFCEIPDEHRLYAAVPCDGSQNLCERGFVAEHDMRDLSESVDHEFLSEDFDGRLVHLACLDETVQVGMARTRLDGQELRENVMEFRVDDPSQFTKQLWDSDVGPRVVYDRRHDAVFYSSEFSGRIYRHDRETDTLDRTIADALYGDDPPLVGSHLIENDAFHEGRDSMFIVQWLSGSKIFELDRTALEVIATYDAHHGGNHGVAVDEELDRLWVTGVWGVEVLKIPTGELLGRHRLGLGVRLPVIDRIHDIVYVPNTSGRLWALDRRTLEVLGSILIGGGSRNPYISADGKKLFASALQGYFYWDTADLAERFRTGVTSNF